MNNTDAFSMNVRRIAYVVLLLTTPAAALLAQPKSLDRIVAVVGREYILQSDLDDQINYYVFSNHIDPSTPGLQNQILEAMINKKLILEKAEEDTTIAVREEDVTSQLDALIAQRVQQAGSEKKLEEVYGMPVSKMKREFRDETRKELMIQQLQQNKFGDIQTSKREVEEFFATYKDSLPTVPEEMELYHIFRLPKVTESAKKIVMARAQRILDSIKAGSDFGEMARRYSDDPGTREFGGDLGFARRGQFFKEFEEAIFSLKENQFANIVETPVGLHIMQLLERRGESVHARHILFKIQKDPAEIDSVKALLVRMRDSVQHGALFTDLAKRYSEDKETAALGGYLGKFTISQFDKVLLEVVKTMKEGEISDPIEVEFATSKGYHIVYLKRRIPEHKTNLQDDWKRVEQLATGTKRNNEYLKWIQQLHKDLYWESRL
jgi:peptidyl-prolyl cis-trans isomerase SurA